MVTINILYQCSYWLFKTKNLLKSALENISNLGHPIFLPDPDAEPDTELESGLIILLVAVLMGSFITSVR